MATHYISCQSIDKPIVLKVVGFPLKTIFEYFYEIDKNDVIDETIPYFLFGLSILIAMFFIF